MNLRVLTYNVFGMPWGLSSIDSILLWCLCKTDAEILCFQEVFSKSEKQRIQEICSQKESLWNCWFPKTDPTYLSRLTTYFGSPSGLCVLTKKNINVLSEPSFEPFQHVSNVDSFIRKGIFHLHCEKDMCQFHILAVHFQSDFTELKCCRISHQDIRIQQEIQLLQYAKRFHNVFAIGDFNTSRFYHFFFVNPYREPTFHETGESLDHCLTLHPSHIQCQETRYFHEVELSDHVPVLFHLRFLKS